MRKSHYIEPLSRWSKHEFVIGDMTNREIYDWCVERFGDPGDLNDKAIVNLDGRFRWTFGWPSSYMFSSDQDAFEFKMRWF